ncbi:hypothetical protein TorRG33x02_013890 [Trema orientale]|uniref:Uncharacterized protein n=1 Tax=Trema orientale TaxID=63057 RepID=A0A2P5FXB0_TREOI|nr:hypothetical protein TorRG33x02_013890 [Trema orientale]
MVLLCEISNGQLEKQSKRKLSTTYIQSHLYPSKTSILGQQGKRVFIFSKEK